MTGAVHTVHGFFCKDVTLNVLSLAGVFGGFSEGTFIAFPPKWGFTQRKCDSPLLCCCVAAMAEFHHKRSHCIIIKGKDLNHSIKTRLDIYIQYQSKV